MATNEIHFDVYRNIEAFIHTVDHQEEGLTDLDVGTGLDAVISKYRAEVTHHPVKPFSVTGRALKIAETLVPICEARLGRGTDNPPASETGEVLPPLTLEEMLECLKTTKRRIQKCTSLAGSRGYLLSICGHR